MECLIHASEFIWSVFSGGSYYILFSISVCVLFPLGRQFYVNEVCHVARFRFQHEIPFMEIHISLSLYPYFFFLWFIYLSPCPLKIQLCWTACNSPKLISLCFCKCSYLFLVIVKDHICLYLPGKTLSSEVGLDGLLDFHSHLALQLTRCLFHLLTVNSCRRWQCLIFLFFRMEHSG